MPREPNAKQRAFPNGEHIITDDQSSLTHLKKMKEDSEEPTTTDIQLPQISPGNSKKPSPLHQYSGHYSSSMDRLNVDYEYYDESPGNQEDTNQIELD